MKVLDPKAWYNNVPSEMLEYITLLLVLGIGIVKDRPQEEAQRSGTIQTCIKGST